MYCLIGCKLANLIDNLTTRKFSDEDIRTDLLFLKDKLDSIWNSLSSYDEYMAELSSGKLDMSAPTHTSEIFWKNNIGKIASDKESDAIRYFKSFFFVLIDSIRILCRLLQSSQSEQVLSVAAHDIGQIVKYHPKSRKY